jgi:hypothetical protein
MKIALWSGIPYIRIDELGEAKAPLIRCFMSSRKGFAAALLQRDQAKHRILHVQCILTPGKYQKYNVAGQPPRPRPERGGGFYGPFSGPPWLDPLKIGSVAGPRGRKLFRVAIRLKKRRSEGRRGGPQ